jgi:predicted signal transduction protein with EAL and GGDEF domain
MLILLLLCGAQFLVVLDATIVNVALPSIQRALQFTAIRASVRCPAEAGDGRVAMGELGVAGFSWTSWDMIQKLRRADQAHSGATDATRTGCGFTR